MPDIDLANLSSTQIAIATAAAVTGAAYLALVVAPAWQCYGRLWEKIAASFLTLFILATLLGVGAGIGFAVVWTYDQYGS
jgi:hypothetical protein